MKVQLAIIGAVLVAGGILFLPETMNQFPAGTAIADALVADVTSIKEYNSHTNQVGETLYDVGLKAGDTVVDVAGQVENTIDETEIPEIDFLKLEE
ncbi:MAG: hypothetical protein QF559_00825 [Candidatus Nitrosopelagicus sp.]|jgi:hypothetical protein|nr:hypothetical protein [Candidatus Nitrosopelagicus sp.]|tara:strand:+ start:2402 stop:2689 length:288 start_codon:yes stop_codon:yes gene_type:complete